MIFAKGATPGGMVQGMGRTMLGCLVCERTDGRMDRQTDSGKFNSPPSSFREAGDKNVKLGILIHPGALLALFFLSVVVTCFQSTLST